MLQVATRFFSFILSIGALAVSTPTHAQTLEDVLEKIDTSPARMTVEERTKLEAFQADGDPLEMRKRLLEAREALRLLEENNAALEKQVKENQAEIKKLEAKLETGADRFGHLLGQFRFSAGETAKDFSGSLANFENPNRVHKLRTIAESRQLPTHAELDELPASILREMLAQSEIKTFRTKVIHADRYGALEEAELMRIGIFVAATTDGAKFITLRKIPNEPNTQIFPVVFPGQADDEIRQSMASLIAADQGDVVRAPIDATRGQILTAAALGR